MFKENMAIFKIARKDKFLKIGGEDFTLEDGFITFYFATYDKTITSYVKNWIPISEAALLAHYLTTDRIVKCHKQVEQGLRTYKPYIHSGGTEKNGECFSRQMFIEMSTSPKAYLTISTILGPAEKTTYGLYKMKNDEASKARQTKISLALSYDEAVELGISIQRSIFYFDLWKSLDLLEQEVERRTEYIRKEIEK